MNRLSLGGALAARSDSIRAMPCRHRCGACCTAPSITSPIPGMAAGKPAGVRCIQLDEDERCRLFGRPERPAVCASLQPHPEMCGASRPQAMAWLGRLELHTAPAQGAPGLAARPGERQNTG